MWESDLTPTIHLVVRELFNLRDILTKISASPEHFTTIFAGELLKNIERRFPNCGSSILINSVGHLLDPQFKGLILHEFDGAFERARKEVIRIGAKYDKTDPVQEESIEVTGAGEEEFLSAAERLLKRNRNISGPPNSDNSQSVSAIDNEFAEFLTVDDTNAGNSVQWWLSKKGDSPS